MTHTPSWRTDKRSAAARGYDAAWRRLRDDFLREHPLCQMCERYDCIEASTVVDHKKPHRGDRDKLMDRNNLQALCKPCHDQHKQSEERGHPRSGCNVDGFPVEGFHHWNA